MKLRHFSELVSGKLGDLEPDLSTGIHNFTVRLFPFFRWKNTEVHFGIVEVSRYFDFSNRNKNTLMGFLGLSSEQISQIFLKHPCYFFLSVAFHKCKNTLKFSY